MKKHFSKRNESINKRLMESWGYKAPWWKGTDFDTDQFHYWARSNWPGPSHTTHPDDHQQVENDYARWRDNSNRKKEYENYLAELEKDKIQKVEDEWFAQDRTPDKDPLYNYRFEEGNTEKAQ